MQKYLRSNKGFTLVEVIVVAVIVLILAAVAIPLYQGYVKSSRQAVVDNFAGSLASFVGAANQIGATVTVSQDANITGFASTGGDGGNNTITIPKGLKAEICDGKITVNYIGVDGTYTGDPITAEVAYSISADNKQNCVVEDNTEET